MLPSVSLICDGGRCAALHFNVLGGPEGRFRVVDGKVDVVSTTHIPAFHGPEDLQSFIASVKQA